MKKTHRHRSQKDTNVSKRQKCYSRIQQNENLQHARLQNSTEDDSDNEEQIFLRQYKEEFLEKQLEPGDTLQTLSIQFNCPIAELKRINNIHRDNEVFARRLIKVPVKYFSLFDNVGVHKSQVIGRVESLPSSSAISIENNPLNLSSQPSTVIPLLNSSINNHDSVIDLLSKEGSFTKLTDPKQTDDVDEDQDNSRLLPEDTKLLEPEGPAEVFQCSGSDWGLSWLQLLLFTLLLVLGGPILYLLYHAQGNRFSHNVNHHLNATLP